MKFKKKTYEEKKITKHTKWWKYKQKFIGGKKWRTENYLNGDDNSQRHKVSTIGQRLQTWNYCGMTWKMLPRWRFKKKQDKVESYIYTRSWGTGEHNQGGKDSLDTHRRKGKCLCFFASYGKYHKFKFEKQFP